MALTRYNIASVHRVLILDEAKAIHQLHFHDLTSFMLIEVVLNVCLGG